MITYVKRSNADKYSDLYERATETLKTHTPDGTKVEAGDPEAIMASDADAITSLEEYFSYIIELNKINSVYTVLPIDEEVFEIDANARTITVPSSFAANGISVQGDEVSEIVYFKIARFYDATDLATKKIYIQWTAPSGDKGVSAPWVIDIESEPNYIIFGWPLSSAITKEAGTVSFSVRFYSIDDKTDQISYSLATLTQTAVIKPSLDFDIENLGTTGVAVDNATALITGRLVDTTPTNSSAVAEQPIWIIDADKDSHAYDIDTEAKTLYANLDKDSDGFTTVAIDTAVQAIAPDAGQLSYYWKAWDYDTNAAKEIPQEDEGITFFITADDARKEGKLYYYQVTKDEVVSYKLYNGELDEDSVIAALGAEGKVYEKKYHMIIRGIGKYQAVATNRVRNAFKTNESYTIIVPRPVQATIDSDLKDSEAMAKTGETKVALTVVASKTDDGKLTYEWFKKAPGETEFTKIEDANESQLEVAGFVKVENDGEETIVYVNSADNSGYGDGYYYCVVTNNLNKEKITTTSNTVRVTHVATAPVVTIEGEDAYTLEEIKTEAYALKIKAEIPADSGEMVEGWRTSDDTLTYQWYKYYAGNGILADDIEAAANGTYVLNHDLDLSTSFTGLTDPDELAAAIEATRKPVYDPTAAGYYFCLVTNTYNGTTATKISRFFSVADA